MDSSKQLRILVCALMLVVVSADAGLNVPIENPPQDLDFGTVKRTDRESSKTDVLEEIKKLQFQLENLEAILKAKDSNLQDKEEKISSLESELNSFQQKGKVEAEENLFAAQDRAKGLEEQVEKLQDNIQKLEYHLQSEKEHAETLEATITDLSSKNSKAAKTIDRQQRRLHSSEEALKKFEAALHQAEHEAAKKEKELAKAIQAWLPHWFAKYHDRFQELAILEWDEHGKPVMDTLSRLAYHLSSAAHELVKPHLEIVREKWIPGAQQQWRNAIVLIVPHIETAKCIAVNGFESVHSYISPHVQRTVEALHPYTQLVRKKATPYVDKVGVFVQPYFKQVHKVIVPQMEKSFNMYQELLKLINTYFSRLQNSFQHNMLKHETVEALASEKFIWFLASALLFLPVLGIVLAFSSTFGSSRKITKPVQNPGGSHGGTSHKRRKSKQVRNESS